MIGRASLGAALWIAGLAPAALAGDPGGAVTAGNYCPIPEPGETPECLDPAKAQYEGFFSAIESGDSDAADLAGVEEAVARGAGEAEGYLALSSLTYGYYQLSQRAARTSGADPAIARRLERWNEIFAQGYGADPDAERWRGAVREAAEDLERHAAPIALDCRAASGRETSCTAAEAVLWNLDQTAADAGYRGGLEKLLERWFGVGES